MKYGTYKSHTDSSIYIGNNKIVKQIYGCSSHGLSTISYGPIHMKNGIKILLLIFFLTNAFAYAQDVSQPEVLTLQKSLEIALQNNLQVKQSGINTAVSAINLRQARHNLLPDISADLTHGLNQGRSIDPFSNSYVEQNLKFANLSLGAGITLFNGLIIQNTIKQNSLDYEASKMELQQTKDNLTLNVILTYFQILSNEDLLNQLELQAQLTGKQVERSELMNKEGAIIPSQLTDLKGQLASDQLNIISTRNSLMTSKIALTQLMNVNYNPDFKVERLSAEKLADQYSSNPESIYQSALQQLAMIKASMLRRESAQKAIQVARGARLPILSLYSNIFSNYSSAANTNVFKSTTDVQTNSFVTVNGTKLPVFAPMDTYESKSISYGTQIKNNYSSSFSLGLRIPIFNSWRVRNRVALAKIELSSSEISEESTKVQLKQTIDLAWSNMITARQRYETSLQQVEFYQESFKSAEARFNEGASTVVDYTIAKNNLDRSNINVINSRYDYIFRIKILDYYQGKLNF